MTMIQNLHTHSTFCDGKNTPEEMVAFALQKGLRSLGFSGHSYTPYSLKYCMTPERTLAYRQEILRLKEVYRDRLDIFLGMEFDLYSPVELSGYDYLLGSMHYFKRGDTYYGFDRGAAEVQQVIDQVFGGDGLAFAEDYYRNLSTLPDYGKIDILAHFDLITKNCEQARLFDQEDPRYIRAAKGAISALKGRIPFFEVNTGAISRGYRTTPYPTLELIREFRMQGYGAVISSDCHNGEQLDQSYELARQLLAAGGYTEQYILTKNGFQSVAL